MRFDHGTPVGWAACDQENSIMDLNPVGELPDGIYTFT
jgi:hypothetical protein